VLRRLNLLLWKLDLRENMGMCVCYFLQNKKEEEEMGDKDRLLGYNLNIIDKFISLVIPSIIITRYFFIFFFHSLISNCNSLNIYR
jgi:hypothetical protein